MLALHLALALAAYPTPAEAGFHHCALIYNSPTRTAEGLLPYVAELTDGKPTGWMFDSFLFLVFGVPSGQSPFDGKTTLPDWQYHFDQWFGPGRDLAALDEALGTASRTLGPVPARRPVMFSIPRPSTAVEDFGDVDGDGLSESLRTPEGRRKVYTWFIDEGGRRFAAAGYRNLALWGFYWMNEGISTADEKLVREAADLLHARDLRFFWIPWYRAPGAERWRELGFDVALMQPNYAFFTEHHGEIRRNRLTITADVSRPAGLGVEMELPMGSAMPAARNYFLRYLAEGAPARLGWQAGATAYYMGVDDLGAMCRAKEPWRQDLYHQLAAYLRGDVIADPDPHPAWSVAGRVGAALSDGALAGGTPVDVATAALGAPGNVSAVDVFLDEPDGAQPWRGQVRVTRRETADGPWLPGGWAMRTSRAASDGRRQVVTAPVGAPCAELRVQLTPPAEVAELGVDGGAPETERASHLALRRPYRFEPAPEARYGDSGHELTDGLVPEAGFGSGGTVGWYGGSVTVSFDLGRVRELESAELHVEAGGYAAVYAPDEAALLLATDRPPPTRLADQGSPPEGFALLGPEPLAIDRTITADHTLGHLTFRVAKPVAARFATFVIRPHGWLMLAEARLFAAGVNVAPECEYLLRPAPSSADTEKYPDDGTKLTDGMVAEAFSPRLVAGWTALEPRVVTLDLGQETELHAVTAWSLRGGLYGIYAPGEVSAEGSADGRTWAPFGRAPRVEGPEDGKSCVGLPCRVAVPAGTRARWVRVSVRAARGWAMLSELAVE
ncbi:MAG: DUF4855 domain-containing protein [Armatimonadetes bacterium]|nr:DUF4855 domain-containing protein [Armatimonadota bacterium]